MLAQDRGTGGPTCPPTRPAVQAPPRTGTGRRPPSACGKLRRLDADPRGTARFPRQRAPRLRNSLLGACAARRCPSACVSRSSSRRAVRRTEAPPAEAEVRRGLRRGRGRRGRFSGCAGASLGRAGPAGSAPSGCPSRRVGLGSLAALAVLRRLGRPAVSPVRGPRARSEPLRPARLRPAVTLLAWDSPLPPLRSRARRSRRLPPRPAPPALCLASCSLLWVFAGSGRLGCPPLPGPSVHPPERRPLASALGVSQLCLCPSRLRAVLRAAPRPASARSSERKRSMGSLPATSSDSDSGVTGVSGGDLSKTAGRGQGVSVQEGLRAEFGREPG